MKVVKIDGENCHIFWMAWGISMKFSGIMSLMIILKVTKKTEIYLPSRRYIFRKTTVGVKLTNQIRFNDSFTEKPHTVCSKFLWPFSTFNFLIGMGTQVTWFVLSWPHFCFVLAFLFANYKQKIAKALFTCLNKYVKGFSGHISHINCRLWK